MRHADSRLGRNPKTGEKVRIAIIKAVNIKVIHPQTGKPNNYRFRAKKGYCYSPEQVDEMVAKVVEEVDTHFAGYEFRLVAMPDYCFNIVPVGMPRPPWPTPDDEVVKFNKRFTMKQFKVSLLGHEIVLTVANNEEVQKSDSTAITLGDHHIRFSAPIQAIEDITPAAVEPDPNLVQGSSTFDQQPDAEVPKVDIVQGVTTHSDTQADGVKAVETPEPDAETKTEVKEFTEASAAADLEADVNDSKQK